MKTQVTAVALVSALFFTSCKKEPSKNDPTYIVSKATYYDDNGSVDYTASYTYNGKNISRIDIAGNNDIGYYTYEYNGTKVVKRNEFASASSTTANGYESINYNSDGSLHTIEHYSGTGAPNFVKDMVTAFVYTDKHLTRVTVSDNSNGSLSPQIEYDYTYTSNNITSVKIVDLTTTPNEEQTVNYTYDTHSNYFAKLYPQPFVIDPASGDFDESTAPTTLSTNNVINAGLTGSPVIPVAYTLDEHQNLTEVKIAGRTVVRYEVKQL
jgi:hypothetical protein